MALRTIMIFPQFENIEIINRIREKYDPLAKLINPHITIVFPFESEMSNEELRSILNRRLNGIKKFDVELQGFSKCEDVFGNFLFLDVKKGREEIINLHNCLYENEFKEFDLGLKYIPHITVGKLENPQDLTRAYEDIKNINCKFEAVINKISVEMIGVNEESIIIIEKELFE